MSVQPITTPDSRLQWTLDVEVLNHGKWFQKGVTDIDRRELLIWSSTWDTYLKNAKGRFRVLKCNGGPNVIEFHMCFMVIAFPECWHTINEFGKSWAAEIKRDFCWNMGHHHHVSSASSRIVPKTCNYGIMVYAKLLTVWCQWLISTCIL